MAKMIPPFKVIITKKIDLRESNVSSDDSLSGIVHVHAANTRQSIRSFYMHAILPFDFWYPDGWRN
jgi:hypothetical protein